MVDALQSDFLAAGEDLVLAILLVPLGERSGHMHFFDDVPPADAGIVSTEGDFAFLRRIGNNTLLGTPEIVIEQVLEPHAGDKQEVPTVLPALLDVVQGAIASHLAVAAR